MDILDTITKLMSLALHNPNEEEARSAAMKAVELIVENKVPLGTAKPPKKQKATWTPEQQTEFDDIMNTMLARKKPDEWMPTMHTPEPELDDGFMKRRIILAWHEIRKAREELVTERHNLELYRRGLRPTP